MTAARRAERGDLRVVAGWLRSEEDCRLWAGTRVRYPVDLASLPDAIQYPECDSWVMEAEGGVAAFGQLVPKASGRLHLARLLVAPERRRRGLGTAMSRHLLEEARSRGARRISLNVLRENRAAIALYRELGFIEARRPPDEPETGSLYMEHRGRKG